MNELRQIEKAVKKYEKVLDKSPELIKQDLKIYRRDVKSLMIFLDVYMEFSQGQMKNWKKISMQSISIMKNNFFITLKRNSVFWFANRQFDKSNKNLEKARTLRKDLVDVLWKIDFL